MLLAVYGMRLRHTSGWAWSTQHWILIQNVGAFLYYWQSDIARCLDVDSQLFRHDRVHVAGDSALRAVFSMKPQ